MDIKKQFLTAPIWDNGIGFSVQTPEPAIPALKSKIPTQQPNSGCSQSKIVNLKSKIV